MVNYLINMVTGENEETKFSLFSLTGEQREYFTINIFPIFDTFYFKIFFFLVSTLIVFLTAITAAFIVIKCFEYIHRCVKASKRGICCYRRCVLPPSYSTVVKVEGEGLPTYSQACKM
eukprot:TRINITY_DN21191_c0_g1_i1.p1 TRINITY_DN21191_c0_g1~~TRINITY_DN21191_c0_g1_i1.p1  ORF type:complete len:118 (-),score=20.93 TRINITY_DN21191_c0_g1_i1:90-443(-)